jgi:hypothetical protein
MSRRPPRPHRDDKLDRRGPKKWSRVQGTVYGIRCMDAKGRRTLIMGHPKSGVGYVGMYSGWWRERIRQHLYGGGPHHCKPKLWRVLVDGYDPNAVTLKQQRTVVDEIIRRGNAFIIWQKRRLRWNAKQGFYWKHMRTFYWWVKLRESWAILKLRPIHNILENTDNPRHIPKWELERLLKQRELRSSPQSMNSDRPRRKLKLFESMDDDRWTGWAVTHDDGETVDAGWYGSERDSLRAEFDRRIAGRRGS